MTSFNVWTTPNTSLKNFFREPYRAFRPRPLPLQHWDLKIGIISSWTIIRCHLHLRLRNNNNSNNNILASTWRRRRVTLLSEELWVVVNRVSGSFLVAAGSTTYPTGFIRARVLHLRLSTWPCLTIRVGQADFTTMPLLERQGWVREVLGVPPFPVHRQSVCHPPGSRTRCTTRARGRRSEWRSWKTTTRRVPFR